MGFFFQTVEVQWTCVQYIFLRMNYWTSWIIKCVLAESLAHGMKPFHNSWTRSITLLPGYYLLFLCGFFFRNTCLAIAGQECWLLCPSFEQATTVAIKPYIVLRNIASYSCAIRIIQVCSNKEYLRTAQTSITHKRQYNLHHCWLNTGFC